MDSDYHIIAGRHGFFIQHISGRHVMDFPLGTVTYSDVKKILAQLLSQRAIQTSINFDL